ncbi:lysozyme [Stenotrophomonas sp. PS02301]|uniref:lysozyme n=1 Tax=Stenotrophomonas sp. PS02301 TaxID=2991427 RepID=UPI00249C4B3F|nr:lysozyme [Stenotrophomonas sp. PS02301]
MKAKIIGGSAAAVIALTATALVKPWEGYSPDPYVDMVGVVTYCYGDTGRPAKARYTEQECAEKLSSRLGQYMAGITACIDMPLRQNEWAAVLSWTYNVGVGAACRSTLVRKINAGHPAKSWCAELDRWVFAGGKRVQGLANRRADERRMCEGQ